VPQTLPGRTLTSAWLRRLPTSLLSAGQRDSNTVLPPSWGSGMTTRSVSSRASHPLGGLHQPERAVVYWPPKRRRRLPRSLLAHPPFSCYAPRPHLLRGQGPATGQVETPISRSALGVEPRVVPQQQKEGFCTRDRTLGPAVRHTVTCMQNPTTIFKLRVSTAPEFVSPVSPGTGGASPKDRHTQGTTRRSQQVAGC